MALGVNNFSDSTFPVLHVLIAVACSLALLGVSGYALAAPAIVTSPAALAVDGQDGFEELGGPKGIATVTIGSSTYALVAAYGDDGLQIIDITDPFNPIPVASVTDGRDGFEELDGARYVTTVTIGPSTYALVTASADHGVQIIDITDPANPAPAGHISSTISAYIRDTRGIATVTVGPSTYALVASHEGRVLVFDITDPSGPIHTATMDGTTGGFDSIFQPRGIATVTIGTSTYALVALYGSSGLVIANVTDPSQPVQVATVGNGQDSRLGGATAVTAVTVGSSTYALVAAQTNNAIQIINITDPSSPEPVAFAQDGHGGFDRLNYPESIATATFGSSTYAIVAAFLDGIQVVDITDPSNPVPAASVSHHDARFGDFRLPEDIATVSIGSRTYILAAANAGNSVPIIEVALTSGPRLVSSSLDEGTGILRITFSNRIDVTPASLVDLPGMTIRYLGQSVPLAGAELEIENDSTAISVRLTEGQAEAVTAMELPRLDLADSSVVDTSGNAIYRTYGNAITVTDDVAPEVTPAIWDGEAGILRIAFSDRIDVTPSYMVYQKGIVVRDSAQSVPLTGADLDTGADSTEVSLRLTGDQRRSVSAMSSPLMDIGYSAVVDTAGNPIMQSSGHPIALSGANTAPSVSAGAPRTVDEGGTVALNGTASDPDNDPLTYLWTHNSTGLAIAFGNATSPHTTLEAPRVDSTTVILLTLTATDQHNATASDTATVTVANVNRPPSAEAGAPRTVADGSGVTVGIADTGINHPWGLNDKVTERVSCDDLSCSSASAGDVAADSHGTSVALIVAGSGFPKHNGIAPGVDILDAGFSLSWLGAGDATISNALSWLLRNDADVVNLSFGYIKCRGVSPDATQLLITGEAVDKGMVVAVPSGNYGSASDGSNRTPVYQSISQWGCAHNVITVGGIDDRDPDNIRMYNSSGRGPATYRVNVDTYPVLKPEIVAPAILKIPRYAANGTDVPTATLEGTSYAAPAVTATAALVLSEREMEPAAVKAAILLGANWTGPVPCTSVQYERDDADDDCSHGRQPGDFDEANDAGSLGLVNNVGFGILDVAKTLDYVTEASGHHLVEGSLESDGDIDGYVFEVTDAEEPVKVILSWTVDHFYEGYYGPAGKSYFADLGFTVDCPGMGTVSAQSAYQANEFAVFAPAQAGTCTVAVTGSGIDTPRRSQQDYAIASTLPLEAVDIQRPEPKISAVQPSPTNARDVAFMVDFGEPVDAATFEPPDVSTSSGTVSGILPANGTAREFTFDVSEPAAGNLTVSIPEGGVLDPAGNNNTASDQAVLVIDRARPAPVLSTAASSPVNASAIAFTVDFGEPVDAATFEPPDVSTSSGTVSGILPANGTAREFTFDVSEPAAGNLTVSIPEGGVLDPAGNNNTASDRVVLAVERPRPSPSLSAAGPSPTNARDVAFMVDFGVPVDAATFEPPDVSTSSGTVSGILPANGTAREFTFDVSEPAAGNLTVSIPEGGVLDPAGNNNTASDQAVLVIDRARPAPVLSTAASSPVNASAIAFTVDFGEPVDAGTFGPSDILATGRAVSDPLPDSGTASSFTFNVSELGTGTVTVSIPEGGVLDPAGNNNTASNPLTLNVVGGPDGAASAAPFATTWKTTGPNEQIIIPVGATRGTYTIHWGDGSVDADTRGHATHRYEEAGTYTVSIYGDFSRIHLADLPDNAQKLQSIERWGDIRWDTMNGAFSYASDMVYRATDSPDLSAVTDMASMFYGASDFNGDISSWNVSSATDMSWMFHGASSFEQNLGDWYIVLDGTTISPGSGERLLVSAQNAYLDGQLPAYAVDDSRFVVADGALAIKPGQSIPPGAYNVTITADGVLREASDAPHSRTVQITVGGRDMTPPTALSAAYSTGNGTLAVRFSEPLNGTVRYDLIRIQDAGQSEGGIQLDGAQSKNHSGRVVTAMLAAQQRAGLALMAVPQLDIGPGAVYDASGNGINATVMAVDVVQDNRPPSAEAGAPRTVDEGGTVALNGTASDPDNDPLTYLWTHNSTGLAIAFGNATSPHTTLEAPRVDSTTVILLTLTATDQHNATASDTATVTVANVNRPPSAEAGAPRTVDEGGTVALNGTASDPDNDPLTYLWTHDRPGLGISLANDTALSTTFTAPQVNVDTAINFMLAVSDGVNDDVTDQVTVAVTKDVSDDFVTTWETSAPDESITVPVSGGTYAIDWGDGAVETGVSGHQTHAYEEAGTYTVRISGDVSRINLSDNPADAEKLRSVDQWGDAQWGAMNYAFSGASNMVYRATDAPDLSQVTDMSWMFARATSFDADLSGWDVSRVTDMSFMFFNASSFDADLSGWDVSKVTDMTAMFARATSFNSDLSGWDVSKVTDMRSTFLYATSFNSDLSGWNVSKVTDMTSTFQGASSFNSDLSGWDVSRVTDMSFMFFNASSFDADLSGWDVSKVTDMRNMFTGSLAFNQNLGRWYIVVDGAATEGVPGAAGRVTAQNAYLDRQNPSYGMGTGGDSDLFRISGSTILLKAGTDRPTGSTYQVTIKSSGGFGTGNSVTMDVTVSQPVPEGEGPLDPRGIGGMVLSSTSPGTIVAAWDEPLDAPSDYRISWAKVGEPFKTWTDLTGNAFPIQPGHTITDLGEGEYKVIVRARYGNGVAGDWSGEFTVAVTAPAETRASPPLGPQEVGNVVLISTIPGTIQASWDAPSPTPSDYRISWAKVGEPFKTWTDLTGNAFPIQPGHTITDLGEGEYKVIVRARYGNGVAGDWSGEFTVAVAGSG